MQSIRNLECQQCRICYDSTNNLQLLSSFAESNSVVADKTYAQLLQGVCNINVMNDKPSGRWPQFICFSCSRKLILAYDFIEHTLKINKLLQSIADLLQFRSESDYIEKPALDIPLEVKTEKDDYMASPSDERKFQYSPVEANVTKLLSSLQSNEIYGNLPCTNSTPKGSITNNKKNYGTINDNIKEILIPSAIEFIGDDVIKDDLDKFHTKIINNMDNATQNDTDLSCLDHSLLCISETKTSNTPANVVCDVCNKSFQKRWLLERHKNTVHALEDNEKYCTICSQNFARPYNYKRHVKNVHKGKVPKKKKTKEMPKETKIINKHSKCTKKIRTKNKLEDFTCNICRKRFLNLSRLVRHKRYTHISEEEKIACNWCDRKFSRSDNYQSHVKRVHNINDVSHIKSSTPK